MTIPPSVKTTELETADEFMHQLSPLGATFGGSYLPGGNLYRGHADSRWPLLPTALRTESLLGLGEWTTSADNKSNLGQIRTEARLLREFFRGSEWVASARGLSADSKGPRIAQ